MSKNAGQVVEADYTGYGELPKTSFEWYQLRLTVKDGGKPGVGASTTDLLQLIRWYARKCEHITEFGVRHVVTTWAFASARPKKLVCVDERVCPVEPVVECCKNEGIGFEFRCEDTLIMDIEETDLLFLDTLHTYGQVHAELCRHAKKVRKYIMIHDTAEKEVMKAVVDFLYHDNFHYDDAWTIQEVRPDSYGLTVLERR
jgi:hypothetical protein